MKKNVYMGYMGGWLDKWKDNCSLDSSGGVACAYRIEEAPSRC